MSITYEEALATLESMFGPPWTRATLDGVLRHHKGHMENTVDSVLSHGGGDPQALINALKAKASGSSLESDAALARELAAKDSGKTSSAPGATHRKGRGTPTTLPEEFLRIPGYKYPSRSGGAGTVGAGAGTAGAGGDNIDQDEMLARMLQDEFFSQELANNPEFAHLAYGPRLNSANHGVGNNVSVSSRRVGEVSTRSAQRDDGPNLVDKIAEMGDVTKKRLQLIAAQFNAKLKGDNGVGGNGNPNQQNGRGDTYTDGAEYKSLLLGEDDDDDVEMSFAKKSR